MATTVKLACILFSTLITNMTLMLIAPVYPILAAERGIGEFMIGLVFMACPLFSCIAAVYIGRRLNTIGAKNIAILGILCGALYMLGMAFINLFDNSMFLCISFISRAVGGIGVASTYISSMSIISSDFSEKRETYTSMMEAFGGLGLMIAPIYYSLTSEVLGFSGVFFVIAVAILLYLPVYYLSTHSDSTSNFTPSNSNSSLKLTKNFALDVAVLVYCYMVLSYLEPTISLYLSKKQMKEETIGFVFAGMTLSYTLTNFFMAWLSKYIRPDSLVSFAVLLGSSGLLLAGPIGDYSGMLWISILGIILSGVGAAVAFISVLPSLLTEISSRGLCEKKLYGKISSLFSFGMNLGEISGPMVSGLLSFAFTFISGTTALSVIGIILLIAQLTIRTKDNSKLESLISDPDINTSV